MTAKYTYGPPPDSDDSDDSSYDGFYFSEKMKREKITPYVQPEQTLYDAVTAGDLELVREQIVALKFPVDNPMCDGQTMLIHACNGGHYELAEYLVAELKADVNKNVNSVVPLMCACDCRATDGAFVAQKLVQLLLQHGAVINVSDKYGMTPFMCACRKGYTCVVKILLPEVSFDAIDNQGCTAIFHAIENNHADIVKLLIESGVNAKLANGKGYTPKQVAEFHGFYDLLDLLPHEHASYVVPSQFLAYSTLRDHVPRIFLKTDCPEYFQELSSILNSINMANMLEHFAKSRISLAEFLNMDDQKLANIGIQFPIHRNKIMKGILDFHLNHWSTKSIARIKKNEMENFYEILMITANHLQHLVIIQASLQFVMQNQLKGKLGRPTELQLANLQSNLKAYRGVINDLSQTVKYLGSFSPPKNPLYIDYNEIIAERKRRKVRSVFKYTTIVLGISVFICLKCKWLF
ncbi:ankyrin repeat, SAM and basic leucine zipper domain-containing protein 1 [Drosophila grimshawi]|uniref:GH21078 n=1 Tax=Drosophila grimshawi TaxID=7222 RepID=B4J5M1_DROGR|nr:ankyrin repeat, SAM and basic leucine zipper domain-containing protein 1 [Drosophila grimshawi]EDW00784.1 GH21078 [Drosophila grimshawi]